MQPVQQYLFHITDYFEESLTFRAIRMGIILIIPMIIIRAFADLCLHLPLPAYQAFLHTPSGELFAQSFSFLSYAVRNYFAVLLTISLGWSFARQWALPFYQNILLPLLTTCCFLIFINANPNVYTNYLSIYGVFSSLLASVLASRFYIFLLQHLAGFYRRAHNHLTPYLHNIIFSIFPLLLVLGAFIFLQEIILALTEGKCLQAQLSMYLTMLFMDFTSFPLLADSIFNFLVHILWFFGINGHNVLFNITDYYYNGFLQENIRAAALGYAPAYIINRCFNNVYILLGGSGSILALILAIFYCSRDKTVRTIAKIGLLPALFNISEIINFGIPLVCNPIFLFPFLFIPLLNLQLAYWATSLHLLPIIAVEIDWTTPIFFSGFLATNSWKGAMFQLLLLFIDFLIYAPFVRFYDKAREHQFKKQVEQLTALYREKESLLEPLRITDLTDEEKNLCMQLLNDLAYDLTQKNLFLLYQPQFTVKNELLGAEALLRWNHPSAGFIYPPLIIALAKTGHLLPALESFIFHTACTGIAALKAHTGKSYKISVNITGDSLKYASLEDSLRQAPQQNHIAPSALWLEITEQDALCSTQEAMQRLAQLKQNGHKLLIDDFGMGHTSVTYLKTDLFDVVKLDGSITRNVLQNKNDQEIISSLISLSRILHLQVIAEFVDNVPQRDKLAELGCDAFQGYLYSRPIGLNELLQLTDKK